MELSHLRVFLEVAEYLNFSKAAKKLHLSQPAVSIKIKSLEKFLKVELFERTQNRLELTKAGIETKASCKKIFEEISICLLYTSPSPRDLSTSRMPSSA